MCRRSVIVRQAIICHCLNTYFCERGRIMIPCGIKTHFVQAIHYFHREKQTMYIVFVCKLFFLSFLEQIIFKYIFRCEYCCPCGLHLSDLPPTHFLSFVHFIENLVGNKKLVFSSSSASLIIEFTLPRLDIKGE